MPIGDLGKHTYSSKTWFDELSRRLLEYEKAGTKEVFTDTSCTVEPLTTQEKALLTINALKLRNRYQRIMNN